MPDGIVCASDYIAHFIQRYLEEKGIDPEGRIVLTGFDNNSEYLNVADRITTVDVKPKTIGSRLATKILFAIEHPESGARNQLCFFRSALPRRAGIRFKKLQSLPSLFYKAISYMVFFAK